MRSRCFFPLAAFFISGRALAVDGTIPNQTYPPEQLFQQISPQLSTLHLNQPSVFNGYLVLAGNAVHEVWDIADPYAPVLKATMPSPYASGEAESHQVTYHRKADGKSYMATTSGKGIDIWDMTVTTSPVRVGSALLPNINYGDVTGAIWGLSWQGDYLYLGATTYGLYVLDVSNPAAPQLVTILNQSNLGGVAAGPVFALGNLLVVTSPKGHHGIATVDISDPVSPKLLDSVTTGSNSYIGGFYGGNAHLITPFRTFDVTTDPTNIQQIGSVSLPSSEYVSFADNFLFLGGLRGGTQGIYKYDITNPAAPVQVGRYVGRSSAWDDQFSCPIGNLIAVADDQLVSGKYVGGLLAVQDVNPDTKPPTVMKVFPKDGAANQALTSKVAVSLSEWPELATVGTASFIVRPIGGQALAGSWSCTTTTLNFAPSAPLLANTSYEIILPAGGVKDLVGNGISSQFRSTFRTGSGITGFPGNLQASSVAPTLLGSTTTFALSQAPSPGGIYQWNFGDGGSASGPSVTHGYTAPGRYAVTLRGSPFPSIYEAETAVMAGGVVAASNATGFTGTGFADYPSTTGTGVYVRWTINSQSATTADLVFRYALSGSAGRPLNVVINGGAPTTLPFPGTGSFSTFANQSLPAIPLQAGANTIELQASAGSQGANVDSLIVSFPDAEPITTSFTHVVHRPLTSYLPTQSQPLALDAANKTVWAANPDADSVTAVNALTFQKKGEYYVGDQPENLALAPDGSLWVVNYASATLSILSSSGSLAATVSLPPGSQPYGLAFAPDGSAAYLTLQALGRVLKINPTTRAIIASLDVPLDNDGTRPQIRGISVTGDGTRLFISRFISPDSGGKVYEIAAAAMTNTRTIALADDAGPDSPTSSRGIPNYLSALAISPDGTRAWLPSKKDNIHRGQFRDGNPLAHDMTVRAITSVIDLTSNGELIAERVDYDDRDRAHGVCFSPLGDLAFVTMPGNNHVQVVNTYTGESITQLLTEKAPTGLLLDPVSRRLYVLNFLSRSLSAFNVGDLINGVSNVVPPVGDPVPLVTAEPLAANVLLGKQLFYDATSTRLNEEGYMSCASCHLDGSQDGRVWDLTNLGEGLRNTIDLRGRSGMGHGRLHWSANFDEIQDFEGQISALGSGTGLMNHSDFLARIHPMGLAKQGLSPDLDALAAYVSSLRKVPASPYRNEDGTLTTAAAAGKTLFNQLSCYTCHGGAEFTDSPIGGFHNVGTLKASSGQRLAGPLTGIDTPTLRGVWATPPYLHNGSAPTLMAVLTTATPGEIHDLSTSTTTLQREQLVAYLQQIDETEPAAQPASGLGVPSFQDYLTQYSVPQNQNDPTDDPDLDSAGNQMEYAFGGTNPRQPGSATFVIPAHRSVEENGPPTFQFSFLRKTGGYWENGTYRVGDLEYQPQASFDLTHWTLPVTEIENPSGLAPAAPGYQWVTYRITSTTSPQGFGRVMINLR